MEEVVLEGDRVQSKQQLCLCLLQDVCLTIKQQKQRAAGRVHGIFYHFNILATASQLRV